MERISVSDKGKGQDKAKQKHSRFYVFRKETSELCLARVNTRTLKAFPAYISMLLLGSVRVM